MGYQAFDQYASEYDAWFLENTNVLETELRLVASCLEIQVPFFLSDAEAPCSRNCFLTNTASA